MNLTRKDYLQKKTEKNITRIKFRLKSTNDEEHEEFIAQLRLLKYRN